jgi:hypothetical protein
MRGQRNRRGTVKKAEVVEGDEEGYDNEEDYDEEDENEEEGVEYLSLQNEELMSITMNVERKELEEFL